jgi:hypothetical protein
VLTLLVFAWLLPVDAGADRLPLSDAHVHYDFEWPR